MFLLNCPSNPIKILQKKVDILNVMVPWHPGK